MGLLDSLLGGVLGGNRGAGANADGSAPLNPMMLMALQLLQQNGGIQGLLAKFQQAGCADEVQSWISTGKNLPISGDVLAKVLGHGQLGEIARNLGIDSSAAAGGLAATLPQVVDQLTPQGSIPHDESDLVSKALAILNQQKPA